MSAHGPVSAGRPVTTGGPVGAPAGRGRAAPAARPPLRSVAVPAEHGGWGLTAEPALLGLLVAPGVAGAALAAAALVAFIARTPLKLVLVDRRRGRRLDRTRLAWRVLAVEAAALAVVVAVAVATASGPFWAPALVAGPLVALELWFDMRSRSRRLVPELAGAVGISSVAAMVLLAGGHGAGLAVGAWLVLAARAVTAIPHVRDRVARLHDRPSPAWTLVAADVTALATAAVAVALAPALAAGAAAVVAVVVVQRLGAGAPIPPPKVLGMRQMALGFAVVAVTAAGIHLAG
ncbi:MAG TPA: YwiC-like family protein [Acidimicrobiales bacterium]